MAKRNERAFLVLVLLLVLGGFSANMHRKDAGCGDGKAARQKTISLTLMDIELIGLSLCEVDSGKTED